MDNEQIDDNQDPQLDPRAVSMARFFTENPDQIPEKFANAENPAQAIIESYLNLEKKLGQGNKPEVEPETKPEPEKKDTKEEPNPDKLEFGGEKEDPKTDDGRDFEWAKNEIAGIGGKASEEVAQFLKTKYNFTDSMVADLEQMISVRQKATVDTALAVIGGKDNYEKLNKWIVQNNSEKEIAEINAAVNGPNAKYVLQGLMAEAGITKGAPAAPTSPKSPTLSNLAADTVQPFKSFAEVQKVLKSDAYRNTRNPDHNRTIAEFRARAEATVKAGKGNIIAGL